MVGAHGFPESWEVALYDAGRNRVTPWFPANGVYVADASTAGITIRYAGFREMRDCVMTLVEGATHRVMSPAGYERAQQLKESVCSCVEFGDTNCYGD